MENFKSYIKSRKSDFVGTMASAICITNCVLTLLVVVVFSEVVKEKYEYINFIFLGISLVSVILSFKTTNHSIIKGLLIYFWIILAISLLFEETIILFFVLKYYAAVGLFATNIWNVTHYYKY